MAALLLAPAVWDATPGAFLRDLDGFSPRLDPVLQWATAPLHDALPSTGRHAVDGLGDAAAQAAGNADRVRHVRPAVHSAVPLAPAIGGGATPARLTYHIQRRAVLPDAPLPPMAVTADFGLLLALLGPAPASEAEGEAR